MANLTVTEIKEAIQALPEPPAPMVITGQEDYEEAGEILKQVKRAEKELKELKDTILRPIDDSRKATLALFRPREMQLFGTEERIKGAIMNYERDLERQRKAIEAELRDQQAKEQAKAERKAERLREQGKHEQAEAALDSVAPVPMVVVDRTKVSGITLRDNWHAEVTDIMALCQAVLEGTVPVSYIKANEAILNSVAKSLKDTARIPGVRIFNEMGVAARSY